MKRTVIAILSMLILIGSSLMLFAETKTITIWAWDPNFNIAIMQEAAARYQKINPNVEFDIVSMAKADVEQKLNTILASGVKTALPEIVLIEDYNAQKYLQSYPGSFADLTKQFNYSEFAPYKVKLMTLNNKVYGVPFDSGVAGWFYRRDYLEQAGFKASDLENITWDRFIEIGKVVKAKTGKYMIAADPYDGGLMRTLLQSAGTWYFDSNGKPYIANNPVLKEAVKLYKEIRDSGIAKEVSGWNEWVGSFNNGDSASVVTGVWIVGSIKAEKSQSGKWGLAPIPRMNIKGAVNASNLGGSSWYVLQNSKNKDVAIDFLKKIYARDSSFYQKILVDRGAVGTWLPAQNGSAYKAKDPFFGNQSIYALFSDWMKKIPSVDYGMFTYEADAAIMAVMPDVYSGKISIDEALKRAEEQFINSTK
ncbi:MAG TPA: sugar ABC transporter substrate-binding protein [Fervidobacterium sp.]|nr:sugar ABC transporter substrate-binding protein [Fervidobacterium sp.]HOP82810.1 sugar ABC transporter substrate-binding protein [Fervidobacterium sp.]HPC79141.1 sugar ABC transporter substrate-binding protein [Fervidobacterium sp.]HPT59337.1 sugar ABC transporter substrate-binding protein [Fervidobacterium sp.]HQI93475.1 sugar ABC transporter substrate-binding protein [Fervidobacterium sp.]